MTTAKTSESAAKKDVAKLQRAIVDGLEDVKAQDIQVFNTEHLSPLFERVIVASGTSNRQTKALAASVRDAVKDAGFPKPRTEGEDNGEWIIVDCGAAVAHIMQPGIRQYYRLEELWGEMPVRLKLGAAKPVAPEAKVPVKTAARRAAKAAEAQGGSPAKVSAKKAPARKSAAAAPASPAPARKAATKAAPKAAVKPAVKSAAKPAAKATAKTAAKSPAAKSPVAKPTAVKTVVVKPRSAAAPAKKSAALKRGAASAKAAPAAKSATGKSPARKAPGRKA
ncbi:MAG: ribosome silencing factor [Burkholderiaceae bacterium]|jgi:ribosome-associated protein|nr:ribosome silencing factor [Burkholderiaceae bacterium]